MCEDVVRWTNGRPNAFSMDVVVMQRSLNMPPAAHQHTPSDASMISVDVPSTAGRNPGDIPRDTPRLALHRKSSAIALPPYDSSAFCSQDGTKWVHEQACRMSSVHEQRLLIQVAFAKATQTISVQHCSGFLSLCVLSKPL